MKLFFVIFIIFSASIVIGQTNQDSIYDPIKVVYADQFVAVNDDNNPLQRYIGDVKIVHDSTFFFCDSAVTYSENFDAFGNVTIVKADTIEAFSHTLSYDGSNNNAQLIGEVALVNGDNTLFAERLDFDMLNNIVTYPDTAIMATGKTKLSSKRGRYLLDDKMAYFYQEVTVIDSSFTLLTDTLIYNVETDIATFTGDSYIVQGNSKVYAKGGFYNVKTKDTYFEDEATYTTTDGIANADMMRYVPDKEKIILIGNAQIDNDTYSATAENIEYFQKDSTIILTGNATIIDSTSTAKGEYIKINQATQTVNIIGNGYYQSEQNTITGDTIWFDQTTQTGRIRGQGVINDTIEQRSIYADKLDYNPDGSYLATNLIERPYIQQIDGNDTTYMSADTLRSYVDVAQDSQQVFIAYPSVKIYRPQMQAVCDSLAFGSIDSTMYLFGQPMAWSDTTQFSADTILIENDSLGIGSILLREKSNIINNIDGTYFDQIKGKYIETKLDSNRIKSMHVNGNAEVIYMLRDDDNRYIGANKTICSSIDFEFAQGELADIKFREKPESTMKPLTLAKEVDLYLKGIKWDETLRPMSKEDIFVVKSSKKEEKKNVNDDEEIDIFESEVRKVIEAKSKKKPKKKKK